MVYLTYAREMAESARDLAAAVVNAAERTRREQQELVKRLRQLEIAAFEDSAERVCTRSCETWS